MVLERVQKILASAGVASRRDCEKLIAESRVYVNGKLAKLGDKADGDKDNIKVDGSTIKAERKVYYILNKPQGYVSSVEDEHAEKIVLDIVRVRERVFPVGRLDKDAQGLMLLTNDGELANRIMHPRYMITKTYEVLLDNKMDNERLEKIEKGMVIDGRRVPTQQVKTFGNRIQLTIHEGRKHIVKRIFERLGFRVKKLKRVSIGPIKLGLLQSGEFRALTNPEIAALKGFLQIR